MKVAGQPHRGSHHTTTMISSQAGKQHQNVSSHPRFNRRLADKSHSPDQEYSEGPLRHTLASTQGTRSMSRVTSTKGPRNNHGGLSIINSSNTQKSIVTGGSNAKKTPMAIGAYAGFGNMPIVAKRPKSSAAYTKKYKPFH